MAAKRPAVRIVLVFLGLALIAAAVIRLRVQAGDDARAPAAKQERQTAVLTAAVERKDVPIELEGIGSAGALYNVTVRPQVAGRITKVFFTEGQPVKEGDVLAQIDPRPYQIALQTAQANLARDQATLEGNQGNYDRQMQLVQGHFVAPQDVLNAKALVGQSQASLLADQAAIDSAKLNLSYARITAPISGTAGIRLIDPGNYVAAGDPNGIVILTQLDPIVVIFSLPQDDLPKVAAELARTGTLPVLALDREGITELARGELRVIDNQVVSTTATIRLKAVFPNAERKLWPNLFVKARLLLETRKGALVVPATAIQRGPRGPFVYVVGKDQTADVRMVKVELIIGEDALMADGLQAGEQVVIEGQNQLRPGAKVQLRPSTEKAGEKHKVDSLK